MTATVQTKSERTRARILDAAARVLSEHGFAGTKLADIAAAADIQAPTIYYYWPSRIELITEVVRRGTELTHEHVEASLQAGATPLERIEQAAVAHLQVTAAISDYATASTRTMGQLPPAVRAEQRAAQERYADLWRALIDSAHTNGDLRPGIDPAIARMLVLGALNWVPEWWNPERGALEDLLDHARAMVRGTLT